MNQIFQKPFNAFLLLLFGLVLLVGCEKANESRPVISLTTPAEHTGFSVGDTMHITGSVKHHKTLSSVQIVIRNNQNAAVTVPKSYFPKTSDFDIDIYYIIDAPGLDTDAYTLVITATDGHNTSNLFRSIHITGVNKHFEKAIILCRPNALKTYVYSIDSSGSLHNMLSINYGFVDSEINSAHRRLFLIKPKPSILYAYDLDDPVPDPLLHAALPYPYFNKAYHNDQITYVATGNGDIKGVNQLGSTIYVTPQNPDTIPFLLHRHYNHILSYCERRGGPERFIKQNYIGTGVFRASLKISFSIVAIFTANEESCLLFGNYADGSGGIVTNYDIEGNYLFDQEDFPAGDIHDVVEVSPGHFIIAHTTGLLEYSSSSGYITEMLPDLIVDKMAYDPVRMLLYCTQDQLVVVLRVDNGTVVQEIDVPYPIYNIHIQHNK
jgi:hypothetical protein